MNRNVWFIVQQNGHIRVAQNGSLLARDFLDLSAGIVTGGEQGLPGMTFSPDTRTTGRFFVNFTNRSGHTVVARFRRTEVLVADPSSRFDLRWGGPSRDAFIAQPFANRNGGNLVFGPDGFLYIGTGDGGSSDDPGHQAQDPQHSWARC
jgi:glucose/arabinose dehydrogenase